MRATRMEPDSSHLYQEADEEQAVDARLQTHCQSQSECQCQPPSSTSPPAQLPCAAPPPHSACGLKSESPSPPQPEDEDEGEGVEEEEEEEDEEEDEEINDDDDDLNSNSLTQHQSLPSPRSPCTLSPTTSTLTASASASTTTAASTSTTTAPATATQSVLDVLSEEIRRFFLCTRPDSTTTEHQTKLKQYIIDCGQYLEQQCLGECRDYKMNKDLLMERMCESEPLEEKHWEIFTFGSESWGTSCTDSDIDMGIFLNFRNIRPDKKYLLDRLASIIKEHDKCDELNVKRILNAKYPILRIRHRNHALNIKVDVSIADRHCRNRDQLILSVIHVFEQQFAIPVKQLIVFIKYWSKQKGINNAYLCYLNSFGYTLLVLKFLEYFCLTLPADQQHDKSLGYLAYKFFQFYSKQYRPDQHAIVLHQRHILNWNYRHTPISTDYFPFAPKSFHFEMGDFPVMQINDPINEHNNVAQKVGEDQLLQIMYRLDEARKLIEAQMNNEHQFVEGQRNPIFWTLCQKTYYQPYYQPWRYHMNSKPHRPPRPVRHHHANSSSNTHTHHTLQLLQAPRASVESAPASNANVELALDQEGPLNLSVNVSMELEMSISDVSVLQQMEELPSTQLDAIAITEQHRDMIADQQFRDTLLAKYEMAAIAASKNEANLDGKKKKNKNKKKNAAVSPKADDDQARSNHVAEENEEEYEVKYMPKEPSQPEPAQDALDEALKKQKPHGHELEDEEKENEHENEKKSVSTSSSTSIAELLPSDQLSDITTNESLPTESEAMMTDGDAIYANYYAPDPYQSNMNLYALPSNSYVNLPFRPSPNAQNGHHGRHYHHRAVHQHHHHSHHHLHHHHHYNNVNNNMSNNGPHYNGNYNAMAPPNNVYYHSYDGYTMNYQHNNNNANNHNNNHRKRKERQTADRRHMQNVNMNHHNHHHQRRRHKYSHV
eukprot:CAMPEP_0197080216 /NCGR_PEP_ID=MMETSP1384-20130603/214018_1 /TAXON_ID=29189 /ORGANISM="Ammonia sp." /LENGTH=942 /DNA_ID=CAMNT_0042519097 /DNA_START=306 /DNA_END=3134 /DNA_ORIENTATION=-